MRAGPKDTTRYVSATAVHVCAGLAAGCRRMSVGCLRLCYGCVLPGADSRIFQTCLKFSRHGHGFAVSAMATMDTQGCTGDPQGCLPDEQGWASTVDTPYYTCVWEGGLKTSCPYDSVYAPLGLYMCIGTQTVECGMAATRPACCMAQL